MIESAFDRRMGNIVRFLTDVKSELAAKGKIDSATASLAGCGYLAAIQYLDEVIFTLTKQKTEIESLIAKNRYLEEEVADYEKAFGELDDWSQYELEKVREIISARNDGE